nr:extracellular serine/threonine protein CG31145-like [Parasteatoda tepidariorum]
MMEYERHNAEIAAYHFDRIMGFRRVPPHVGRKVSISRELFPLVDEAFMDTFFYSPDGNYCFHGKCRLFCDTHHAFCGNPDLIEGSVGAWILTSPDYIFQHNFIRSPWKRSYLPNTYAPWENDPFFCVNFVRETEPFKEGRRIYDAMDCTIFDYIIGNWDRHHYNELKVFANDSTNGIIHFDNGRGFGRADQDEPSILKPLEQCCIVRLSTFNKLYEFHAGPRPLSDLMRESLKKDPLYPVLTEPHLLAMDRRVEGVLDVIRRCVQANLPAAVFLDDILQTYFSSNFTKKFKRQ